MSNKMIYPVGLKPSQELYKDMDTGMWVLQGVNIRGHGVNEETKKHIFLRIFQ